MYIIERSEAESAQDAGELVGAGGPAGLAVHAVEGAGGLRGVHPFEQPADRLEIAVAAADVTDVVQPSVDDVEIDLLGTDEAAGLGGDMAHAIRDGVAEDLEVVSDHGHFRFSLKNSFIRVPHSSPSTPPSTVVFGWCREGENSELPRLGSMAP